jgi:hypothetical protein
MNWLKESVDDDHTLIGTVSDNIITLYIKHPTGLKVIKQKHVNAYEMNNIDFDEIRTYFSRVIDKIHSKTPTQLALFCGNKADT